MNRNSLAVIIIFVSTLISSSTYAQCKENSAPIQSMTRSNQEWKSISNNYTKTVREAVMFEGFVGGLVKIKPGHEHQSHYYKQKLLVVVYEGQLQINFNNKITTYNKGEYFIVPAYTCFSSSTKKGAMIVMVGAKPGSSYPSKGND